MSGSSPVDEIQPPVSPPKPAAGVTCGACNAANPDGGKFCAGCGHALIEPCVACNKPVLLSQAFCGTCGNDLVAAVKKKKLDFERKIADAIDAAKDRNFERAKSLLAIVVREKDFRFQEIVANATVAQNKIDSIATQESASAADQIAAAQHAFEKSEYQRVVELLSDLPTNLLTEEAKSHLQRSRNHIEQLEQAEKSLQEAFQKRDWASSGAILDRLMELQPNDESVAKLAIKVGKKLISKATALREIHKNAAAANMLDCVPENARDQDYQKLCQLVQRIQWLAEQFKDEPFATPTLGRLSQLWVEQSGGDPKATAMLGRISQQIKGPKSSTRDPFAPLLEPVGSWVGGQVGFLGSPSCVDLGQADEQTVKTFRTAPGQFNVAIGLALQGLGQGRVKQDFSPKQGLLKRLGRKKLTTCWGIDLGAFGIKAVCLQTGEDGQVNMVQCYRCPFNTPLARSLPESKVDETLRDAVTEFLAQHDVDGSDVWVGFPGRELVSRFVKLPPVPDKQVKPLFDKEVEARIPLPLDEVTCVSWIADVPKDELTVIGRPAFVSAAKQQFVDRYLENLRVAGLEVNGLQATPIALLNFAVVEFADALEFNSPDAGKQDQTGKLPTVALFDCGAEMTTAMLISPKSCWFWTFESGGNEFTRLVSRATKTTHGDAEKLKRNPATLPAPETQFETVQHRIDELRGRLSKTLADVLDQHDELDVQQTWCSGGGALTLGWIKRILCEQ